MNDDIDVYACGIYMIYHVNGERQKFEPVFIHHHQIIYDPK